MAKKKQKPSVPDPVKVTARLAFSIEELTQATSLSRSFLYAEMQAGHLPYIKIGARRLVLAPAFESYLASQGGNPEVA
jgi:hypothetical protein